MTYTCLLTGEPVATCDECEHLGICAGVDVSTKAQDVDTSRERVRERDRWIDDLCDKAAEFELEKSDYYDALYGDD